MQSMWASGVLIEHQPSRLIFIRPHPSHHHHFRPPHLNSPATTPSHLETSPRSETPTSLHPSLPFPEGCGRCKFARRRNGGGRNTRGYPRNGRPIRCISTMYHDFHRGTFSPLHLSSIRTNNTKPPTQHPPLVLPPTATA